MAPTGQETEVKFYLQHLHALASRIVATGGRLRTSRTHEFNLRFDTAGGRLHGSGRVLRLRQDQKAYLTYKDNAEVVDGALRRREFELAVDDFEVAKELLRALDYRIVLTYEKFRTVYDHGMAQVMLDELPYGHFVEIEGARANLEPLAEQLGLRWTCAIPRSYHALFEHVVRARALAMDDLTFENFADLDIGPGDLGVTPADA
jgi:adenylate cyclase, class 2